MVTYTSRPSMLLDPYVARIRERIHPADLEALRDTPEENFYIWGSELHGNLFRWVRNYLGLWEENHPLTRRWCEEGPQLIDGVDHHPCHPDQVSVNIVRQLQLHLRSVK